MKPYFLVLTVAAGMCSFAQAAMAQSGTNGFIVSFVPMPERERRRK
jgi:hypothetical protein